jgi:hypothetical protein
VANLAVDELLKGVAASFEVEARIQRHNDDEGREPNGRLQELFAAWRARQSRPAKAESSPRRTAARAKRRR